MQLGMIGLGRMGANMVQRLMEAGHQCVVYDRDAAAVAALAAAGAEGSADLAQLCAQLAPPARSGSWSPRPWSARSSTHSCRTSARATP